MQMGLVQFKQTAAIVSNYITIPIFIIKYSSPLCITENVITIKINIFCMSCFCRTQIKLKNQKLVMRIDELKWHDCVCSQIKILHTIIISMNEQKLYVKCSSTPPATFVSWTKIQTYMQEGKQRNAKKNLHSRITLIRRWFTWNYLPADTISVSLLSL